MVESAAVSWRKALDLFGVPEATDTLHSFNEPWVIIYFYIVLFHQSGTPGEQGFYQVYSCVASTQNSD